LRPKLFTFNKEVAAYLIEAPELAKKVETKVLNVKDVEQIAKEYNSILAMPVAKPIEQMKNIVDTAAEAK